MNKMKTPASAVALTGATEGIACGASTPASKPITDGSGRQGICRFLSCGQGNALLRRELEKITGLSGRDIRLIVEAERRAGVPILSDSRHGFFLPASDDEVRRFLRSMRHRAHEILTTAAAVEREWGRGSGPE